ncbi:hypothetical protein CSOJ01_06843 [Colletotrichum sojae]|uniref:Uncharacterized protein n=1 Tax=Colletotrichum sojae TaxID=2175907 RepID=A0A8H6MUK6_9PEZI|nr:hypothetical protein CSOJ01_06843 [Colletotrichum sojae]
MWPLDVGKPPTWLDRIPLQTSFHAVANDLPLSASHSKVACLLQQSPTASATRRLTHLHLRAPRPNGVPLLGTA